MGDLNSGEVTMKLRDVAKSLLAEKKVDVVIGYEERLGVVSPFFAETPEDAGKLVFNDRCVNNLTVYLLDPELKGKKAGIVVKGCDSRALIELIKQNQVKRDDVYAIGVCCSGVKDDKKGSRLLYKCGICRYPNPLVYDVLLNDKIDIKAAKVVEDDYSDISEIEKMSYSGRREFWKKEFDKCVKCFACRNVCPVCYCKNCVLEDESMVSKSGDVWMFHLTRAFHVTGRCVSCGECERVCPAGIPLTKLYRKLEKEIKNKFNYESGINAGDSLPLTTINPGSKEKE